LAAGPGFDGLAVDRDRVGRFFQAVEDEFKAIGFRAEGALLGLIEADGAGGGVCLEVEAGVEIVSLEMSQGEPIIFVEVAGAFASVEVKAQKMNGLFFGVLEEGLSGENSASADKEGETVQGDGDLDSLPPLPLLVGPEIKPRPLRQVEAACFGSRAEHRADEEVVTEEELIVHSAGGGIALIFESEGTHDGEPFLGTLPEGGVEVGQEAVALFDSAAVEGGIGFAMHPGFLVGGVKGCVTAEEGKKGAQLIPAGEQFRGGCSFKAACIGSNKAHPRESQVQAEGEGQAQMFPGDRKSVV